MSCECCGVGLTGAGSCPSCDAQMSSPPHACLRWMAIISDEHGCPPVFDRLEVDHETAWRLDHVDGPGGGGAGS